MGAKTNLPLRAMYLSPLVKAGDQRATRIANSLKALEKGRSTNKRRTLDQRPDHREISRKGGLNRFKYMDEEARRKIELANVSVMHRAIQANMKEYSATMSGAMRGYLARLTPEERAARSEKSRQLMIANNEKRIARLNAAREPAWPFPEGPSKRLSGEAFKRRMRHAKTMAAQKRAKAAKNGL